MTSHRHRRTERGDVRTSHRAPQHQAEPIVVHTLYAGPGASSDVLYPVAVASNTTARSTQHGGLNRGAAVSGSTSAAAFALTQDEESLIARVLSKAGVPSRSPERPPSGITSGIITNRATGSATTAHRWMYDSAQRKEQHTHASVPYTTNTRRSPSDRTGQTESSSRSSSYSSDGSSCSTRTSSSVSSYTSVSTATHDAAHRRSARDHFESSVIVTPTQRRSAEVVGNGLPRCTWRRIQTPVCPFRDIGCDPIHFGDEDVHKKSTIVGSAASILRGGAVDAGVNTSFASVTNASHLFTPQRSPRHCVSSSAAVVRSPASQAMLPPSSAGADGAAIIPYVEETSGRSTPDRPAKALSSPRQGTARQMEPVLSSATRCVLMSPPEVRTLEVAPRSAASPGSPGDAYIIGSEYMVSVRGTPQGSPRRSEPAAPVPSVEDAFRNLAAVAASSPTRSKSFALASQGSSRSLLGLLRPDAADVATVRKIASFTAGNLKSPSQQPPQSSATPVVPPAAPHIKTESSTSNSWC